MKDNAVIWITGLSGSGKSTLATVIRESFGRLGIKTIHLDGDDLRGVLNSLTPNQSKYSPTTRLSLAIAYSRLASLLASQNTVVIVSTISMHNSIYQLNRQCNANYFEIYLNISLEIRMRRDPKKFYKQHAEGNLTSFAGLDQDFDRPICPEMTIDDEMVNLKLDYSSVVVEKLLLWLEHGT